MATITTYKKIMPSYRLQENAQEKERVREWLKVWGIWRDKKPDPIRVMKKLRREWDRKIA